MYYNTKAIVLSSLKFKDADLIVKCYTESVGTVSFMVKGVLKSKKGKLRPATFQVFNILNIEFLHRNKGQLEYFKEVKVEKHLNSIHTNVYKSSLVMFTSEILKTVIFEEEANPALFKYLEESILYLEKANLFANFHISFLVKLSSFLGFSPHNATQGNQIYFNLNEGHFEDTETKYTLSYSHSSILSKFLSSSLMESDNIKLDKEDRKDFLKIMIYYFELHIDGFKKPKSLEVIESIFN